MRETLGKKVRDLEAEKLQLQQQLQRRAAPGGRPAGRANAVLACQRNTAWRPGGAAIAAPAAPATARAAASHTPQPPPPPPPAPPDPPPPRAQPSPRLLGYLA